jgi:hypothetical protein
MSVFAKIGFHKKLFSRFSRTFPLPSDFCILKKSAFFAKIGVFCKKYFKMAFLRKSNVKNICLTLFESFVELILVDMGKMGTLLWIQVLQSG